MKTSHTAFVYVQDGIFSYCVTLCIDTPCTPQMQRGLRKSPLLLFCLQIGNRLPLRFLSKQTIHPRALYTLSYAILYG